MATWIKDFFEKTWTKDFFENDKQIIFEKGLWSYWYQGCHVTYRPIPKDDPDATTLTEKHDQTSSLFLAWTQPFLQPEHTNNAEKKPSFKPGAFLLLFTSGLIEMLNWMLDCLISALIEFPFACYTHYKYANPRPVDLVAHQKSYYPVIVLKRLVSIYFLIPQIKWLWRVVAIQLPSWGLSKNRLGFILGAGCVIALLFFTGGTASLLSLPILVPVITSLLHSVSVACGTAGLCMATYWFAGLSIFSFMAPVIQGVLMTAFVASIASIVGNIMALFMSVIDDGFNKGTGNFLSTWIESIDKTIDEAVQGFLEDSEEIEGDVLTKRPTPAKLKRSGHFEDAGSAVAEILRGHTNT